jgi:CRP/FNR family transcriptional regulator, cyclic AMP receptor protein
VSGAELERQALRNVGLGYERSDGVSLRGLADRGFLARLAPDVIQEIFQSSRSMSYPKGTTISPSRDGSGPALVLSGSLRYFLSASDGRQLTIRYLAPGDLVGTLVREQSNISTHIELLEPSVLLHFSEDHMRAVAARRPQLAEALLDEVVDRLRSSYRALATRAFMSVRARVARDLLERAKMNGGLRPGVHLDVTQQSLADATGSVREVVSRALRDLRQDGVVAGRGEGVTVLDPEALSRAAAV